MAKGAGMLAPALATMLVVLTTDAVAEPADLDAALRAATRVTFDRLDSDGCMSTNDMVAAAGLRGQRGASGPRRADRGADRGVRASWPRQLLADAEGASKTIAVQVVRAASEDDAVEVGRAVARSNLLKCAIHRRGPELGSGAGRGRHHLGGLRAGPPWRWR